jgi:hypothetical protein
MAIVLSAFLPSRQAGFATQAEGLIVAASVPEPKPPQLRDVSFGWWDLMRSDVASLGQFRPVGWAIQCVELALFGSDARLWHAASLAGLLVFTCATYGALRHLGLRALAAATGALGATFNRADSLWVSVGYPDLWGLVFLALALYSVTRATLPRPEAGARLHWDGMALACLSLAALCKEPYLLTFPVVLVGRIILERARPMGARSPVHRLIAAYLTIFSLLAAAVLAAARLSGARSYGGTSEGALGSPGIVLDRGWDIVLNAAVDAGFLLPVWIVLVLSIAKAGGTPSLREHITIVLMALLWVGPQVLVYSTRPVMWDYYYHPLCIGLAGLNAWAVGRLLSLHKTPVTGVVSCVVAAWAYEGWRDAAQRATQQVAHTALLEAVVREAARRSPPNGVFVLAGTPAGALEPGLRIMGGMGLEGRKDVRLAWLELPSPEVPFEASLSRTWMAFRADWPGIQSGAIGGVCLATPHDPQSVKIVADFSGPLRLRREDLVQEWFVWSWRRLQWTPRHESYVCWFRPHAPQAIVNERPPTE